jgi:hypothetical protein
MNKFSTRRTDTPRYNSARYHQLCHDATEWLKTRMVATPYDLVQAIKGPFYFLTKPEKGCERLLKKAGFQATSMYNNHTDVIAINGFILPKTEQRRVNRCWISQN